jgi:ABC-type glycerol-3-phosphate transport system substrate-binding protein
MTGKPLSRRAMLKLTGLGLVGATMAACGATATPTPEKAAAQPTKAPVAATPAAPAKAIVLKGMMWGGAQRDEARDQALRTVYPDLPKVEFVVGGAGDGEVANALRLALASGDKNNIPDIVQFNKTQVPEFAISGELLDLGDIYDKYKSDIFAGVTQVCTYENKYVGFPLQLKSKMFYYRADMFDQAGIKVKDIKTTADFIAAGKAFHAKFPNSYIINMGPQPAAYFEKEIYSAYDNARFADPGGKWLVTTGQWFNDGFKFFKDVYDAKITLPIEDFSTDWSKGFKDNAIGGSMIAQWMANFLPTYVPEQKGLWKYDLWPVLQPMADQRYGSDAAGSLKVIFKKCPNPKAAADYMTKWSLDKAGVLAVAKGQGLTPMVKSAREDFIAWTKKNEKPPALTAEQWTVYPSNYFGADYYDVEFASYDYLKAFQFDPSAVKEHSILSQWLNKALTGAVTVTDALKNAESDLKSQIGDPYKI